MANNLKIAVTAKNAGLDAKYTTAIGTSGLLRLYTGTQPTNPDTALSGNTQLCELPCTATFAPGASGGVLTVNALTQDSSADATGTATWGAFLTSGSVRKVDFTVGTSAADLNMNSVAIQSGAAVAVTSFTFTSGN